MSLLTLTAAAGDAARLQSLWTSADERGWLHIPGHRVVIIVDGQRHPDLVRTTAETLKEHLGRRAPHLTVDIVPSSRSADAAPAPETAGDEGWRVTSPVVADGIPVPSLYFGPAWLVTIAGAGPDPLAGISSVLRAQMRMLRGGGARGSWASLVYEAHRLCRADLSVACGTAGRAAAATDWWAVSPDDVAVECAVARAAGIDPARLPSIRSIMRHETPPALYRQTARALPFLAGGLTPGWKCALARAWAGRSNVAREMASTLGLLPTIWGRLMQFLGRRLPWIRSARLGAA